MPRDGKGDTALIIAITRGDPDWTGFLLNKGADPNLASTKGGDTPLMAAARIGFDRMRRHGCSSLGAKVDGTNKLGETALIVAVQLRQMPMIKFLLAARRQSRQADRRRAGLFGARNYAERDNRGRADPSADRRQEAQARGNGGR